MGGYKVLLVTFDGRGYNNTCISELDYNNGKWTKNTHLCEKRAKKGDERCFRLQQLLNLSLIDLPVVILRHQFRELIKSPV